MRDDLMLKPADILEVRRRMAQVEPHRPQPGDPDYQTPAEVAAIKARLARYRAGFGGDDHGTELE